MVEALTADVTGVQIRSSLVSGAYRIQSRTESELLDEWLFAVNGTAAESDLRRIGSEELTAKFGRDDVRVLGVNEPIDVHGGSRRGRGLWQACFVVAGLALCGEMLLVALSRKGGA
jgi:hypothetical protein